MYDSLEHGWYSYFQGHTLFFVQNNLSQQFNDIADDLDLLVITGGDDSALRRTVEIRLATQCLQRNKPVIGVCHGAFLLTDLLGGTVKEISGHQDTSHVVQYRSEEKIVNSYHTLSISRLHSTATALAVDAGGHYEAWQDGKLAGIVWHPERMTQPWIPDEIQTFFK